VTSEKLLDLLPLEIRPPAGVTIVKSTLRRSKERFAAGFDAALRHGRVFRSGRAGGVDHDDRHRVVAGVASGPTRASTRHLLARHTVVFVARWENLMLSIVRRWRF